MTPADPAHATPATAPLEAVPDYVQALEQAAGYLPEDQRPLLRRAWAVGAAAHAGQNRRSGEPGIVPVSLASAQAFLWNQALAPGPGSASRASIRPAWRCCCASRRNRLAEKTAHISSTAVSNTSLTIT